MMIKPFLYSCLLLLSFNLNAGGLPGGGDELRQRLGNLNNLSTLFEQTVYSVEGTTLQQTEGQLLAARPGKVRWETKPPMEQLVVSDSETLWIYDPDLEQVTIKPFDQDLSKTPAILFIGDLENLEQSYDIFIAQGEIVHFTLIPVDSDSLYQKVALSFRDNTPVAMTLWDTLGQKTHLSFTDLQINSELDKDLFHFIPPQGVDIIRDE